MMEISLQQLLQNSFVISVSETQLKRFYDIFSLRKLFPLPRHFRGFDIKNGIYKNAGMIKTNNVCNCSFSHMALIRMAKSLDLPFICIFEDDAYPQLDILNKMRICLENIPEDIDMLKMGYNKVLERKQNEEHYLLFSNSVTYGSHAYVVFKKYYDSYMKYSQQSIVADTVVMNNDSKILTCNDNLFIQNNVNPNAAISFTSSTTFVDEMYTKKRLFELFGIQRS